MRSTISMVLLAVALSGCGTATMTRLNVSPYETGEFKLVDERPAEKRFSREIAESYGQVTALGDDAIYPTPIQLTRTWIGRTLPEWLRNKTIALKEFTVEVLIQNVRIDEARFKTATAYNQGVTAAEPTARLFIGGIENIRSLKAVTARIVINVDGRDYSGIDNNAYRGRVTEEDIAVVINGALNTLRKNIDKPGTDPAEMPKK